MKTRRVCSSMWVSSGRCRGFTLIELLVVVAIIALLIGILVPSLSGARDSAKRVKTKAIMKGAGDCLELFAGELPKEVVRGANYPSSRASHDPTEPNGEFQMFGAQRLVRYLMGKDGRGYIAPSTVPKVYWNYDEEVEPNEQYYIEKGWYDAPAEGDSPLDDPNAFPLPRSGPYMPPGSARIKAVHEIATGPDGILDQDDPLYKNPVLVDPYDMPILYYMAAAKFANRQDIAPATTIWKGESGDSGYPAIYHFGDNAMFTSGCACGGGICKCWGVDDVLNLGGRESQLIWPTEWDAAAPDWSNPTTGIESEPQSFAYYILDKETYESTNRKSVLPYRSDSYIMISPGRDGTFGTRDDVTNFN